MEKDSQHTIKYPALQPVTTMPIATDTRADPNTFPTTVGMVEKKPPLPAPLMMTKTARGARVVEAGQRASILRALSIRDRKRALSAPILSQSTPQRMRPTAEEKLNPATRPAPALVERPTALL